MLYADGGILTSPQLTRIQESLDVMSGIFSWVVLRTNVAKKLVMTCHMCCMAVQHSEAEYRLWMTEEGLSYRYLQKDRVRCMDSSSDLVARLLAEQHQNQNRIFQGSQCENTPPREYPQLYWYPSQIWRGRRSAQLRDVWHRQ